jgi:hypothetical protein
MTMPHLMNCEHAAEGWCLDCVGRLHAQAEAATRALDHVRHQAGIWKQEARTQKATVDEVGAALGGVPDWGPVVETVSLMVAALAESRDELERLRAQVAQDMDTIYAAWRAVGADCAGLSWEAFVKHLDHAAPAQQAEPDWLHLKAYGYAPGDYMSRCCHCNATFAGLDKRATSCRSCAEKVHARKGAAAPSLTVGERTAPMPGRDWLEGMVDAWRASADESTPMVADALRTCAADLERALRLNPREALPSAQGVGEALEHFAAFPLEEFNMQSKPDDKVITGFNDWILLVGHIRKARAALAQTPAAEPQWQALTEGERRAAVGSICEYGTGFVAPLFSVIEGIERVLEARNRPAQAPATKEQP